MLRLIQTHLSNSIWPSPLGTVALGDGLQHLVLLQGECTDSATLREEVISFSVINKCKDGEKKKGKPDSSSSPQLHSFIPSPASSSNLPACLCRLPWRSQGPDTLRTCWSSLSSCISVRFHTAHLAAFVSS